jgi:hypothetical protein
MIKSRQKKEEQREIKRARRQAKKTPGYIIPAASSQLPLKIFAPIKLSLNLGTQSHCIITGDHNPKAEGRSNSTWRLD